MCFKSSQTFSKGAQPVAPPICKYARLKGPSFIDILPKFHDIWIYRTGVIAPKVTVCFVVGRKMSIEQRANIKFCFKLGKTFTETHQMMQQVYGSDCLWFRRFKDGREHLTDEERSHRPREAVNESNIEKVRQFIKNESNIVYRIVIEHLGLRKVCSRFVQHKLIQHSKGIIKEAKKDRNFLYSIETGDETWCFYTIPKPNAKVPNGRPPMSQNQKNRAWKNQKSKHCSSLSTTPRELFIRNSFHLAKRLMLCVWE